jgi:hypothetical protein
MHRAARLAAFSTESTDAAATAGFLYVLEYEKAVE